MSAEELKRAVQLIKACQKVEARAILEPIIVAEPQNIQAWIWEIETRDDNNEKIKLMEACLLHNPDSSLIRNVLASLKAHQGGSGSVFTTTNQEPAALETPNLIFKESDSDRSETAIFETETTSPETTNPGSTIKVDPFTPMSEYAAESSGSTTMKTCPHCGELVNDAAKRCNACGHALDDQDEPVLKVEPVETPKKHKWYRRPLVRILTFIFLMPIWCITELSNTEARKGLRVFAGILLAFIINLISLVLFWFFTTNTTRANLYNWYQYLSGQTDITTPGQYVQIDGNIQGSSDAPFSLLELQAKVYDAEGNLLGNSSKYIDGSSLIPGSPNRFQMDVTSLVSPFQSGMTNQQVLFYDDFSNPASGWKQNSGELGETVYVEGQYSITVKSANYDLWSNPSINYSDTKIEVDTVRLGGPENNRFGVQCRYVDVDNYYFAVISSDGYYGIGKVVKGKQTFIPQNGMQVTDKIFAGSAVNHIRFDCIGTRLTLYLNGDYVDSVEDTDLKAGDVGLLAGAFEEKEVKIYFDNFVVFQP
jgi:hypothetical protein